MKLIGQTNEFSFGEPLLNALLSMKRGDKIARTLTAKVFPYKAKVVFDGHYDANTDGKILFSKDEDGTYQQMKPGKFLRRVFPTITDHCSDQDIERFVNYLKSKMSNGDIEVWEGDDIHTSYLKENHLQDSSTLGCSCMNNKPYVKAYTSSGDTSLHPKVACVMKDGSIAGKALIWESAQVYIDHTWQTRKVMDRIYSVEDKYIQAVAEWGFNNGYIVRDERNYDERMKFYFTLADFNCRNYKYLEVRIDSALFSEADEYPYTDTFHFDDDTFIYNSDEYGGAKYACTGGGREDHYDEDYVTLACGDRVHQDDATYVEGRGEYYINDDTVWACDYALHIDDAVEDYNGDWIHEDDSRETYFGNTVHENEIQHTDCDNEYAFFDQEIDDEDVIRATAGQYEDGYILAEESVTLGDGTIVHKDDDVVTITCGSRDGEDMLEENCSVIYDNNIVSDDDEVVTATAGMYEGEVILEEDSFETGDGNIVHLDDDRVTATWGSNEGLDILETLSIIFDGHILHEDEQEDYILEKKEKEQED